MAQYWKTLISSSNYNYTWFTAPPFSSAFSCQPPPAAVAAAVFGKAVRIRREPHPQNRPLNVFSCHSNTKNTTDANVKRCLRCNTLYNPLHNSPTACSFHGHINGEKGLFALAPPHQGIDGEWTDRSGVIVYKWNQKNNRPNTGAANWKKRWSCCSEYDENAPPCQNGWHVSYDDGFTLY